MSQGRCCPRLFWLSPQGQIGGALAPKKGEGFSPSPRRKCWCFGFSVQNGGGGWPPYTGGAGALELVNGCDGCSITIGSMDVPSLLALGGLMGVPSLFGAWWLDGCSITIWRWVARWMFHHYLALGGSMDVPSLFGAGWLDGCSITIWRWVWFGPKRSKRPPLSAFLAFSNLSLPSRVGTDYIRGVGRNPDATHSGVPK